MRTVMIASLLSFLHRPVPSASSALLLESVGSEKGNKIAAILTPLLPGKDQNARATTKTISQKYHGIQVVCISDTADML
jgi:hypothetical protein